MAYPTDLPSYTAPDPAKTLDQNNHTQRHSDEEDDIVAIATKVGIDGSADTTSHDYKLSGVTGSDKAASVTSLTTVASDLTTHEADTANPHSVTKTQVGLGNVDNTSDATKNSATASLTNKTIDGNNNTLVNLSKTSMVDRTRRVTFMTRADGSGGAVETNSWGPGTAFTGTPSAYVRGAIMIPADYSSGDVTINIITRATNTAASKATLYYIGSASVGDDVSSTWDVASAAGGTESWTANILKKITLTITAANFSSTDMLVFAWRPNFAITGTIYVEAAYLEYTADM